MENIKKTKTNDTHLK